MSTESEDLVGTYSGYFISRYASNAIMALICYEHLITLKYEVDFLCNRKWNASTWIFMTNRYLLLACGLLPAIPVGQRICAGHAVELLNFLAAGALSILPMHAFAILRIYAFIQDRSWRLMVTLTLSALALIIFVLDTYVILTATMAYANDRILGPMCYQTGFSVASTTINQLDIVSSVIGIVSAAIVLIITITRTIHQVLETSSLGIRITLSKILLRDGSLFFLIILIDDIICAIPTVNVVGLDGGFGYILTPILNILPSILLSRFLINLRQASSSTADSPTGQYRSRMSIMTFRIPAMDEVIGNLGESLEFAESNVDDSEDGAQDGGANETMEQQDKLNMLHVSAPCVLVTTPETVSLFDSGSGSTVVDV